MVSFVMTYVSGAFGTYMNCSHSIMLAKCPQIKQASSVLHMCYLQHQHKWVYAGTNVIVMLLVCGAEEEEQ